MGGGDDVRQLVEAQARARVADDVAAFASYLTPQALLQLGGNGAGPARLPRPRRFDVLDVAPHGDAIVAAVRFGGGGVSYELRTTWQRIDAVWKAVDASVPAGSVRVAWWRRLLGRGAGTLEPPARRDLS
jgi:hypothetical protein